MDLKTIVNAIAVKAFRIGDIIESARPYDMCSQFFKVVNKNADNISVIATDIFGNIKPSASPGWLSGGHTPNDFFLHLEK